MFCDSDPSYCISSFKNLAILIRLRTPLHNLCTLLCFQQQIVKEHPKVCWGLSTISASYCGWTDNRKNILQHNLASITESKGKDTVLITMTDTRGVTSGKWWAETQINDISCASEYILDFNMSREPLPRPLLALATVLCSLCRGSLSVSGLSSHLSISL